LTFDPELRPKGDYIHDIVTDKAYKSFELSIEWNISEEEIVGFFGEFKKVNLTINRIPLVLKYRF
jgi:hypothetical protein